MTADAARASHDRIDRGEAMAEQETSQDGGGVATAERVQATR